MVTLCHVQTFRFKFLYVLKRFLLLTNQSNFYSESHVRSYSYMERYGRFYMYFSLCHASFTSMPPPPKKKPKNKKPTITMTFCGNRIKEVRFFDVITFTCLYLHCSLSLIFCDTRNTRIRFCNV